jgi:hypothetical protein
MLDRLRWLFPFVVALAAARFAAGDREEALRLAGAALLGLALYALLLTG